MVRAFYFQSRLDGWSLKACVVSLDIKLHSTLSELLTQCIIKSGIAATNCWGNPVKDWEGGGGELALRVTVTEIRM